jgi:hypothetical protein
MKTATNDARGVDIGAKCYYAPGRRPVPLYVNMAFKVIVGVAAPVR